MVFRRLDELSNDYLPRGSVLRVPGSFPHEERVDLMVFDPQDDNKGQGLIVTTGYKAGLIYVVFPKESEGSGNRTLCRKWLLSNWSKWGYPGVSIADVCVCENYDGFFLL